MKKLLLVIVGVCLFFAGMNFFATEQLYKAAMQGTRFVANLEEKSIEVDEYNYAYLDNGEKDKPVILLVHGFSADKDNWPRMALSLTDSYRLVALDLLGHGDSDQPADANYSISAQVDRVNAFARALGLEQFHMIGNSMGGHISGIYAARYPEDVLSVTFLNNGGVISPEPSDMWAAILEGKANPLIMRSVADADTFFEYIFVTPPFMTDSIKNYFATRSMARAEINEHIFSFLRDDNFEDLSLYLPAIQSPVQIIWGENDRILHVSSIEVMTPLLEGETVVILPETGHAPMMERPKVTAMALDDFIRTL